MEASDRERKTLARRVAVAAVGIPIVVGAVVVGTWLFTGVVSAVAALAAWEYGMLIRRRGGTPPIALIVGGAALQVWGSFLTGGPFLSLGMLSTVVVLVAWTAELGRRSGMALWNTAAVLAGVVYCGGLLSVLPALRQAELYEGAPGALVLTLLGALWVGDSAAYAVGRRWGRRLLAPSVSPRKTWEGALACFAATALTFWGLAQWWIPRFPSMEALALGMLLGIVGQVGDLAESQLKRDAGVKDSSALLPGHGGMLDRVDSLLFAAPCLYLWLLVRGWLV